MSYRVGIDIGGTFTDFALLTGSEVVLYKNLSTPEDRSVGVMSGLEKLAEIQGLSLHDFMAQCERGDEGFAECEIFAGGVGYRRSFKILSGGFDELKREITIRIFFGIEVSFCQFGNGPFYRIAGRAGWQGIAENNGDLTASGWEP